MNFECKQNLVNCIRMLERAKHIDFNGHCSIRIKGTQSFYINSRASSRSSLTVEDILTVDLDGNVLEGNGHPPNEFYIHSEIYRSRDDVHSVIHTHPQWSTLFTIARIPLRPITAQGAVLGEVPVLPKSNSISTKQLGEELVAHLGSKHVILLRSHGAVTVGNDIVEAYVRTCFLEENAQKQYMASQLGYAHSLEPEEIAAVSTFLWQPHNIQKVWDNHYSKLIKE